MHIADLLALEIQAANARGLNAHFLVVGASIGQIQRIIKNCHCVGDVRLAIHHERSACGNKEIMLQVDSRNGCCTHSQAVAKS